MKRSIVVMALVAAIGGAAVATAPPSLASWVDDHCAKNSATDSHVKRSEAQAYAAVGFGEGYEWGGGCWNDNDKDDTPGQPDSSGEGPDCSGYVYKVWELVGTYGDSGFIWRDRLMNAHGPYTTTDFHDASTTFSPFHRLKNWQNRTVTLYMDAFAKDGHIGLLYTSSNPSSDTDYIAEALGDAYGVEKNIEGYRFDSAYVGVRREDWTPDCYPNCETDPVVVVLR
jgi:hypothetical protein